MAERCKSAAVSCGWLRVAECRRLCCAAVSQSARGVDRLPAAADSNSLGP